MLNKNELDLADIYAAPEITHKTPLINKINPKNAKNITKKHEISRKLKQVATEVCFVKSHCSKNDVKHLPVHKLPECLSTDCSSESDEEFDDEVHHFLSTTKKESHYQVNLSITSSISLHPHRCIKPSLFNPQRKTILAQKTVSCEDELESLSLRKHVSYDPEQPYENLYKIALLNAASKYEFPDEFKHNTDSTEDTENAEAADANYIFDEDEYSMMYFSNSDNLSEEDMLKDLYSAPETQ